MYLTWTACYLRRTQVAFQSSIPVVLVGPAIRRSKCNIISLSDLDPTSVGAAVCIVVFEDWIASSKLAPAKI